MGTAYQVSTVFLHVDILGLWMTNMLAMSDFIDKFNLKETSEGALMIEEVYYIKEKRKKRISKKKADKEKEQLEHKRSRKKLRTFQTLVADKHDVVDVPIDYD